VLGDLPRSRDPRVLIDFRTADDAGVYRWGSGPALVQSVDFFTPIVDDPRVFGRIAAANALSDIYAMGGRPRTALAIAAFPATLDHGTVRSIFEGGLDTLAEADVALLGGHTVQDKEIKFGYAITGEVDPDRVWANAGAKPGDSLILTKSIGTGVITTALKHERAPERAVAAAIRSMTTLNRAAAEALAALPRGAVHACTDITGFGLLGHAAEMAEASACGLRIQAGAVPVLDGALELALANTPGGGWNNEEHFAPGVRVEGEIDPARLRLLYDPQTSGGLLAAIDPAHQLAALDGLRRAGVEAVHIGEAAAPLACRLVIVP
jgi:selenide, water dikinase